MIFIYGKCPICGKLFKANTHGRPRKYCSKECKIKQKNIKRKERRIITQKCQYCGKTYKGNKDQIYCSDECRKQAELEIRKENRKITQKCQYCGKIFDGNEKQIYCSVECANKANQDKMNKRNTWRWYNDPEYRAKLQFEHGGANGTIKIAKNPTHDWEKEQKILNYLKKKAGLPKH